MSGNLSPPNVSKDLTVPKVVGASSIAIHPSPSTRSSQFNLSFIAIMGGTPSKYRADPMQISSP